VTTGSAAFSCARTPVARPSAAKTLWRPGALLKKTPYGRLVDWAPNGFYQTNDDVTVAIYKVPGYAYPVAAWFDNATRKRMYASARSCAVPGRTLSPRRREE